jgi:serine/threonine protein kinase
MIRELKPKFSRTEEEKCDSKEMVFFWNKIEKFEPTKTKELKPLRLRKMLATVSFLAEFASKNLIADDYFTQSYSHSYQETQISVKIPRDGGEWEDIEHEARMTYYAQQASKRVLNLKNVFYDEKQGFALGLEYMPVLDMLIYDTQRPLALAWYSRLSIALQVAQALHELHTQSIIHQQIRSRHVFVDLKNGVVKLGNFRRAHFEKPPSLEFNSLVKTSNPIPNESYCWRSPEELKDSDMGIATDIYGFGILLYELATGSRPFAEKADHLIMDSIRAGNTCKIPIGCPIKELIESCWALDPAKRPKAMELVEKLTALLSLLPKEPCSLEQEVRSLTSSSSSSHTLTFP